MFYLQYEYFTTQLSIVVSFPTSSPLDFCTHASIEKKEKEGADSKTVRLRKRKYWFLMDEEMIRCTNWWRRQRGMKPLHMPAGRIIGEVE
jgi:hypothetical protein